MVNCYYMCEQGVYHFYSMGPQYNCSVHVLCYLGNMHWLAHPVTVNLVRRGIWSGGHNSLGKLVRRTEFPNFVHRENSPGLRNLVRAIQ